METTHNPSILNLLLSPPILQANSINKTIDLLPKQLPGENVYCINTPIIFLLRNYSPKQQQATFAQPRFYCACWHHSQPF